MPTLTFPDITLVEMLNSDSPKLSNINDWLQPAVIEYELFLNPNHYVPGTCTWFHDSSAFQLWAREHSSSFLWVHGHPGTGKTILSAKTVSKIRRHDPGFCAYFFCDWADPTKRRGNSIIRTIASQLAQENTIILKNMNDLLLQNFSLSQSLSVLWRKLVGDQVIHISGRVYIVIDGLDECEIEDRNMLMSLIVSTEYQAKISWLIFSRYLPDIADLLVGPNFVVNPFHNSQDVRAYVEQCVKNSRILNSSQLRNRVIDTVHAKARGVFLWVRLIIRELDTLGGIGNVLAALESLPHGIEELYNRIFERLDRVLTEEQLRIISTAFRWIAAVSRPMTVIELTKAVELSIPDIGELFDLKVVLQEDCGGLVTVSNSNMVGFIHQTVQQYVYSGNRPSSCAVNPRAGNVAISKICLSYLSGETFAKSISSARFQVVNADFFVDKYPLLSYAAIYWAEHVDRAGIEGDLELMEQLAMMLCSSNILTAIEVAVTVGGIDSLQQWFLALSNLRYRLISAAESELVTRFTDDLQQLIRKYGRALGKFPGEIFYLIDECFPRRSHFWKYFGHKGVFLENGQSDEWDPIIATLNNVHVNCIAISRDGTIAASGKTGISIINPQLWLEVSLIHVSDVSVIAIAFSDAEDVMVILCQNGTLMLVSTQSWQVTKEISGIVQLPRIVRQWDEHQFWKYNFRHFNPVHVNLGFVGKGVMAGNTLVYPATHKKKAAFQNMSLVSSTSIFASTTSGDLVSLTEDGTIMKRRLGEASISWTSEGIIDYSACQSSTQRLLAISITARLIATCTVALQSGHSISQTMLDCVDTKSRINLLSVDFGKHSRITAAAFSSDESMLVVNDYNTHVSLDTTKIWRLAVRPQLIWERTMFDAYTTSLVFGLKDTILVQAGRVLRVWDVNMISRTETSAMAPLNLLLKICCDGTQVASVPGEISVENPKLFLWRIGQAEGLAKIPWPDHLCCRNVNAIEPLAFSADGTLVVWDHAVISTENYNVVDVIPLSGNEKVCHVGGLNSDSSIIVYSVDLKLSERPRHDIPVNGLPINAEQLHSGDLTEYIMRYDRVTGECERFYSTSHLSLLRSHPSQPLVGFVAKAPGGQWTAYIYNLQSRQFIAESLICTGSPSIPLFKDITFLLSGSLVVAYPQNVGDHGDDFLVAWKDINIFHLQYGATSALTVFHSERRRTIPWHSCHLLPSGRIVYFAQDGWVVLWDHAFGMRKVKYISSLYGLPISVSCTAVVEVEGNIRVLLRDISMGLLCFDIEPEKLFAT